MRVKVNMGKVLIQIFILDNPYHCESIWNDWKKECPSLEKKSFLMRRALENDEKALFNQADLDKYFKRKAYFQTNDAI